MHVDAMDSGTSLAVFGKTNAAFVEETARRALDAMVCRSPMVV